MQHFTASSRLNLTGGRLFLVVLMSVLGGMFIVRDTDLPELLYLNVHSVNSVIALGRDATFFSQLNVESLKRITL